MGADANFGAAPADNGALEQAVLGIVLASGNDALDRLADGLGLNPEDFGHPEHQAVWSTILSLSQRGRTPSPQTVAAECGLTEIAGTSAPTYLMRLALNATTLMVLDDHVATLRDASRRRALMDVARGIAEGVQEPSSEVSAAQIAEQAEAALFALQRSQAGQRAISLGEAASAAVRLAAEAHDRKDGLAGLSTGITELDRQMGGLQRSDLVVVAARPGVGKTALALDFAKTIAANDGAVAFFSLEMSAPQLAMRLLAGRTGISSARMRRGAFSDDEFDVLTRRAREMADLPVVIDQTGGISIAKLTTRARRIARAKGLKAIFVDYLQLMTGPTRRGGSRVEEITAITTGLKSLAKDLDVPVVALSQLSRQVEHRVDKRPLLADLRDSGCLAGDTLVLDPATGRRRRIDEMVSENPAPVLTAYEQSLRLGSGTASRGFCTGRKPVFEMVLDTGRKVTATGNHNFLTQSGWKRLDEISDGDFVATPRSVQCLAGPQAMSADELVLLAHMIGDGCALPSHALQYTCGEEELAHLVADTAISLFGPNRVKPRVNKERGWYQVYLSAVERLTHGKRNPVGEWLRSLGLFGRRAHEKFVPEPVFESGMNGICLFLSHLWATDGHVGFREETSDQRAQPAIFYSTSSERLARDVQALLLRIGIVGLLRCVPQTKGRDSWCVHVSGQPDTLTFLRRVRVLGDHRQVAAAKARNYLEQTTPNVNRDVVPADLWWPVADREITRSGVIQRDICERMGRRFSIGSSRGKNFSRNRLADLAAALESPELSAMASSDIYWDGVRSIADAGVQEVFDLTVPGTHNFVANDIIVHNSVEQDADVVLMIYRDEYYIDRERPDEGTDEFVEWQARKERAAGRAEIIIAKQRHGPLGAVDCRFDGATTSFHDRDGEAGYGQAD